MKRRGADLLQGTKQAARAEEVNVGSPGKSARKNNTEEPVLWDKWQGDAAKMHGAAWKTAERTEDHDRRFGGTNTKGKPPAKTPGVHSMEGAGRLASRSG